MNKTHHIVIVGATSSIAQHCARLWVQDNSVSMMSLIGRNKDSTEKIAADLRVRNPQIDIRVVATDFLNADGVKQTVDETAKKQAVTIALIAHGMLPEQSQCQTDLQLNQQTLEVNGVSPMLFAEAFAQHMEQENYGKLAIIGSVAGDRGRKSNYAYGSAKAMVSSYSQGLQHRFAGTQVKIILIKPGPTATPMTASLKNKNLADATDVARNIVQAISKGKAVAYIPKKWWLIMLIIKNLPRALFNKLDI